MANQLSVLAQHMNPIISERIHSSHMRMRYGVCFVNSKSDVLVLCHWCS